MRGGSVTRINKDYQHLAEISKQAYEPADKRQERIGDWLYNRETSHDKRAVYHQPERSKVAVGFKGTDVRDPSDLLDDALIARGRLSLSPRVREERKFVKELKKTGLDTTLTGHSLGAAIANQLSHDTGMKAVGFSTPVNPATFAKDTVDKVRGDKTRVNFTVKGDPIGVSHPYSIRKEPKKGMARHSVDNFIK